MKRFLPFLILLLGAVYLGSTLLPPRSHSEFNLRSFARLPVLVNGRIKPLDTVARTSLLVMQGRQRFTAPGGQALQPVEWLLDVLFNPAIADDYRHFLIQNPEVLAIFGREQGDQKRFSFNELRGGLSELERQMRLAEPVDDAARTPFQREVVDLYQRLVLYQRLKASLNLENSPDFLADLVHLQQQLPAALDAFRAKKAGQPYNEQDYQVLVDSASRFQFMSESGYLLAIPPDAANPDPNSWSTAGAVLLQTFQRGAVNPDAMAYAALGHAWRLKQPQDFNEIVRLDTEQLAKRFQSELRKCRIEAAFNQAQPFYSSMVLYVMGFLLAVVSWLKWPDVLQRSAFWLMALAFVTSTAGIATRMWLEGRPPVTNLYSSALFVGWVAVALCLILERIYRNAIGAAAGSMIGFGTLIIAQHLALSGDTMEMMRAVLDSNFWLATHVVVITIGYGSTFLAGILAIIYIVMGVFTSWLKKAPATGEALLKTALISPGAGVATAIAGPVAETNAKMLERMVYGIVCFATLFSLVGTVLGGIWADQSWGRFWGWDPKENGALIIVLWNAIILHCRWGGLVRARGLMLLAVFGNVVTSWSWFGVNMLGVGLHSYGFMQSAFYWLIAFVASQVLIIGLASLPLERWRSFRRVAPATAAPPKPGLATP
jgi:cytochrome c-type biogenesis protein CcsB